MLTPGSSFLKVGIIEAFKAAASAWASVFGLAAKAGTAASSSRANSTAPVERIRMPVMVERPPRRRAGIYVLFAVLSGRAHKLRGTREMSVELPTYKGP